MIPTTPSIATYLLSTTLLLHLLLLQSHAFTSSPVRTTITTIFADHDGARYKYSPTYKMTSIFLSSFDDNDMEYYYTGDNNDNDENDDDDDFVNFQAYTPIDVDSAREQLESLVGAGSPLHDEEHQVSTPPSSSSTSSRQPPQRSTLTDIRLLHEESSSSQGSSSSNSISAGASIASMRSMLDVTEPPPLSIELPHRPPMTSIERERRLAEIDLLHNLLYREADIADLWSLWFAERGPQAEAVLKEADELMGGPAREQLEAERLLRSLIEEHGVYFVEPINRLATLYFTQGRMEESLALNKIVLAVKPWHVGALSHIVMVYEAMGDSMMARSWACFRLPNISSHGSNKRRERWVERAVHDAKRMIQQGEQNNVLGFGEADRQWVGRQQQQQPIDTNVDDDAWQ